MNPCQGEAGIDSSKAKHSSGVPDLPVEHKQSLGRKRVPGSVQNPHRCGGLVVAMAVVDSGLGGLSSLSDSDPFEVISRSPQGNGEFWPPDVSRSLGIPGILSAGEGKMQFSALALLQYLLIRDKISSAPLLFSCV